MQYPGQCHLKFFDRSFVCSFVVVVVLWQNLSMFWKRWIFTNVIIQCKYMLNILFFWYIYRYIFDKVHKNVCVCGCVGVCVYGQGFQDRRGERVWVYWAVCKGEGMLRLDSCRSELALLQNYDTIINELNKNLQLPERDWRTQVCSFFIDHLKLSYYQSANSHTCVWTRMQFQLHDFNVGS